MGKEPFLPKWQLIHVNGTDKADLPASTAIKTKQKVRNVVVEFQRTEHADKSSLSVNADPIINEMGEISHVICSFTEISGTKEPGI